MASFSRTYASDEDRGPARPKLVALQGDVDVHPAELQAQRSTETMLLHRVVGDHERAALAQNDWKRLPSRDEWPVLLLKLTTLEGARESIARSRRREQERLNIVAIPVDKSFAKSLRVELPNADGHRVEYWLDATRLDEFNGAIRGEIHSVT